MYSDLNALTKIGITTLLMLFVFGIAINLDTITQNMVQTRMDEIQRSTLTTSEMTLRELATEGKVINGAMLYSALLQYGDSVQGYVIAPNVFGTGNPTSETKYGPTEKNTPNRTSDNLIDLVGKNITKNYIILVNENSTGEIGLWLYIMSGD